MSFCFPRREEIKLLKDYLERVQAETKYFQFAISSLIFTGEEIETDIIAPCTSIVQHVEEVLVPFYTSQEKGKQSCRSGESGNDEAKLVWNGLSLIEMIQSDDVKAYALDLVHSVSPMREKLQEARETLHRFNKRHGYLFTADFKFLKAAQRDGLDEYKLFERLAAGSTELSDFVDLVTALEEEHIPSNAVRRVYSACVQTASAILDWISSILSIESGEGEVPCAGTTVVSVATSEDAGRAGSGETGEARGGRATHRVQRVRLYEVHDIHHVYNVLLEISREYFLQEYQTPNLAFGGCRLKSAYFSSLRDHVEEIRYEMERLESIRARDPSVIEDRRIYPVDTFHFNFSVLGLPNRASRRPTSGAQQPSVVFKPSIHQVCFLLRTLQLYLAVCTHLEAKASEVFFLDALASVESSAQSALETVRAVLASRAEGRDHPVSAPPAQSSSPDQGGSLQLSFELYRNVRGQVHRLTKALEWNLAQSRKTQFALDPIAFTFCENPVEIQQVEFEAKKKKKTGGDRAGGPEAPSWWKKVTKSLQFAVSTVTCQAEYSPSSHHIDDVEARSGDGLFWKGIPITIACYSVCRKERILVQLKQLRDRVEEAGEALERAYPGQFYRGTKEKFLHAVDGIVASAERYSVVFSGPSSAAKVPLPPPPAHRPREDLERPVTLVPAEAPPTVELGVGEENSNEAQGTEPDLRDT